jgi:predicted dehydrogenase
MRELSQAWPLPRTPRPIVVVGAGSIVRDAHLPVYRRLGFPVAGLFDSNREAAEAVANQFSVGRVYLSLAEAAAEPGAVFDLAVPPQAIHGIVSALPEGSPVLIQKPLGVDLPDARRVASVCRERGLLAASNFQLRFSPNMLALAELIRRGDLGDLLDVEVRVVVHTPWEYWSFLKGVPRLEILMHSIHYIDLVRLLLGDPLGVYCKGLKNPLTPEFADARTTMILDYPGIRCSILANHSHRFGPELQQSQIKVEGTRAAAIATMGVNLDYPRGKPDELLVAAEGGPWESIALRGSWFLEAFEGPMSNLQRFAGGEDLALVSPVSDSVRTMAVVEACYASSAAGGTPVASEDQP